MRCCSVVCVAVLLSVLGFAPAPLPRRERAANRDDLETMQGLWKMTGQWSSGTPIPHDYEVRVRGKRWTFINVGQGRKSEGSGYHLFLDQTASPRALMWSFDEAGTSGFIASYRLQGRTLTIVYTSGTLKNDLARRPTDFDGRSSQKMAFEFVGRD